MGHLENQDSDTSTRSRSASPHFVQWPKCRIETGTDAAERGQVVSLSERYVMPREEALECLLPCLLRMEHGIGSQRRFGREKFARHLHVRGMTATQIFEGYAALTTVVAPAIIPPAIIEDPDDDAVLACAVSAKADLVVSGDPHLVKLEQYEGIPIVAPAEAVERLGL